MRSPRGRGGARGSAWARWGCGGASSAPSSAPAPAPTVERGTTATPAWSSARLPARWARRLGDGTCAVRARKAEARSPSASGPISIRVVHEIETPRAASEDGEPQPQSARPRAVNADRPEGGRGRARRGPARAGGGRGRRRRRPPMAGEDRGRLGEGKEGATCQRAPSGSAPARLRAGCGERCRAGIRGSPPPPSCDRGRGEDGMASAEPLGKRRRNDEPLRGEKKSALVNAEAPRSPAPPRCILAAGHPAPGEKELSLRGTVNDFVRPLFPLAAVAAAAALSGCSYQVGLRPPPDFGRGQRCSGRRRRSCRSAPATPGSALSRINQLKQVPLSPWTGAGAGRRRWPRPTAGGSASTRRVQGTGGGDSGYAGRWAGGGGRRSSAGGAGSGGGRGLGGLGGVPRRRGPLGGGGHGGGGGGDWGKGAIALSSCSRTRGASPSSRSSWSRRPPGEHRGRLRCGHGARLQRPRPAPATPPAEVSP